MQSNEDTLSMITYIVDKGKERVVDSSWSRFRHFPCFDRVPVGAFVPIGASVPVVWVGFPGFDQI
jgi:hypothetical protein